MEISSTFSVLEWKIGLVVRKVAPKLSHHRICGERKEIYNSPNNYSICNRSLVILAIIDIRTQYLIYKLYFAFESSRNQVGSK